MAVGDLLTERAALRAELDRARKAIDGMVGSGLHEYIELTGQIDELTMDRDDLLEALKTLVGCIEGYPDMMAEPAVAECMSTALEALDAVEVSDE